MPAYQKNFRISTLGHCDVHDITGEVERIIGESGVNIGIANVSGKGSTLAITTIEFEPGAVSDLKRALDQIAPENDRYAHNARWNDHNGFAHLRSALVGTSAGFPVKGGELYLGTWQQVVLCDFDDRPREREVTVTVVGE
jgi:secondary thiamine-phosphate synthase enzyme